MSVVGFDVGNYKSSIGIARAGGIEIIANEYSDRITPTYVSFTNNQRFQGHAAKQQEVTNNRNTITGFKRLLARKPNDSQVQNEKNFHPLRISQEESVRIEVDYLNETRSLSAEQLTGVFLTKLKSTAESSLNMPVTDCVVSVPSYFTDAERRALLDASQIAGLNCLKLMNETTAVALCYGLYHTDLPDTNDKPHVAVFVDVGYTSLQASAVAFNKGKLRMLASTFDNNLGGRDFDKVLMDYFQQEFLAKYKVDAYSNVRARLRLRTECEKVKKLMSANSSPIPLNIECFLNDIDVSAKIKRDDFERLSEPILARVQNALQRLLVEANLRPEDIAVVEIVGGSTRIPAIKRIVQDTFLKEPSTTLNADEACARGCTIMCAILSPNFKVKEFKIEDCQLFPITLSWKGAETDDNELEVFPKFEKIPLSKLMTIYKRDSFEIEARYRFPNDIPYPVSLIGKFQIGNVTPNAQGENSEIKLKARITKNGIFEILSPQMIETFEVEVAEQAEAAKVPEQAEQKPQGEQVPGQEAPVAETANQAANPPKMVKKKKTKSIDLLLSAHVPQLSKQEINLLIEQELSMIQQNRKECERAEAKNAVEEYIYDIRGKICGDCASFITEQAKSQFMSILDEAENWLYTDEAENQEKSVYVEKLASLKRFTSKIMKNAAKIAHNTDPGTFRSRSISQHSFVVQNKLRTMNPAPPPKPKLVSKPVVHKPSETSHSNTLPKPGKTPKTKKESVSLRSSMSNLATSKKSPSAHKLGLNSNSYADLSNKAFYHLAYPKNSTNSNSTSNLYQTNLYANQFGSQVFNYPGYSNKAQYFYPNKGFNIQYFDRI